MRERWDGREGRGGGHNCGAITVVRDAGLPQLLCAALPDIELNKKISK